MSLPVIPYIQEAINNIFFLHTAHTASRCTHSLIASYSFLTVTKLPSLEVLPTADHLNKRQHNKYNKRQHFSERDKCAPRLIHTFFSVSPHGEINGRLASRTALQATTNAAHFRKAPPFTSNMQSHCSRFFFHENIHTLTHITAKPGNDKTIVGIQEKKTKTCLPGSHRGQELRECITLGWQLWCFANLHVAR